MTTGGLYRKAGLMVRESLDPWSVRLIAQLAPYWEDRDETHLQFVARDAYGEPGRLPVARDVVGVPRVVRLAVERVGDTLTVEYSLDGGATWIRPTTGLGGSISIPGLAPELLVGLDMVSNDISTTSTAHFDDLGLCTFGPAYPDGYYAFETTSTVQDRESELQALAGGLFTRIPGSGVGKAFSEVCDTLGKVCTTVVDWEGTLHPCTVGAFDGSRIAHCES